MLAKCAILIVWLLAGVLVSNAEIDCKKRLDIRPDGNCCTKPSINFEHFRQSCGKHMKDGIPNLSPCLYDCIFNVSNVMTGMQFNEGNARIMIQQLLGSNKDFTDVYTKGLQNCTDKAIKLMENNTPITSGLNVNCSSLAMALATCTLRYVFINCPTASWTNSKVCEDVREYNIKCVCDSSKKGCKKFRFMIL